MLSVLMATLLILFLLKSVSSTFNKCAPIFYKVTNEWSLLAVYLFLVPVSFFAVLEFSHSAFGSSLHVLSFISALIFLSLLIGAIVYAVLLILRNKAHLTKQLFQYQNGFLYSMFTLSWPHFLCYSIPLLLFLICSILMAIDFQAPSYLLGAWSLFTFSLVNLCVRIFLRKFKTLFLNIIEIACALLFCLIWIPLLIKVHRKETSSSCSGGSFVLDLFFPILALTWLIGSFGLLVFYIVSKRAKKSTNIRVGEHSKQAPWLIPEFIHEKRIDFAKSGKLEFLEAEISGHKKANYRTPLDQVQDSGKGERVGLGGTLLQSNNALTQNQLNREGCASSASNPRSNRVGEQRQNRTSQQAQAQRKYHVRKAESDIAERTKAELTNGLSRQPPNNSGQSGVRAQRAGADFEQQQSESGRCSGRGRARKRDDGKHALTLLQS